MKTKTVRIAELFKYLWSAMDDQASFHLEELVYPDRVIFRVRTYDIMTVYATVYCGPRSNVIPGSGYLLEVNYPAFNGELDAMKPFITALKAVETVVKFMSVSDLLKEAPCEDCERGFCSKHSVLSGEVPQE